MYVTCSCCGMMIRDDPEHNRDHGVVPPPRDEGFGMCFGCGGDPNAEDIKKQLGWAGTTFYEARFDLVKEKLSPPNQEKFEKMSYKCKVAFIARLIEKGCLW